MTPAGAPTASADARGVRIAIIGAGFGGIGVGIKLLAAGHRNVTVYERASGIGGTWWHNTYPGVACDAPSHIYSYSFAQQANWSRRFAPAHEIQAYLRDCVDSSGLAEKICTDTEVVAARWAGSHWVVE